MVYRVKVQHDNGSIVLKLWAADEAGAVRAVMSAEGCPRSAILWIRPA